MEQQMLCIQKVPSLVPNNKAACGQNKQSGAKWISLVEDSNKCSDVKQRGEALGSLGLGAGMGMNLKRACSGPEIKSQTQWT